MGQNQHCTVCIRNCKKGQSFCHRRDEDGNLIRPDIFCATKIDYLFEKPVVHFRENTKVFSLGSWGCNLRCLGCQNVNLSWSVTGDGLGSVELIPSGVIETALENNCAGICYTYNEPAILLETVENIAAIARQNGLFNVLVTNSTLSERSVKRIAGYIDAVASDIKSLDNEFYFEYCGASGITEVASGILKCIKAFKESGCHVEVRTNIIPGANDQEENFRRIACWIRDNLGNTTPWHITRFFPANKLNHLTQTPVETMLKARKIGLDEGLVFVQTFIDKGCDCADEKDLVSASQSTEIHDCCKYRD